jgi:hypothetical protein
MELSPFGVRAGAGSFCLTEGVALTHAWTTEGVVAAPASNGAQVLHLAVALCVLNDVYREAATRGIDVRGVLVGADGGFDDAWRSTGITYAVQVDTDAPAAVLAELLQAVDEVAEIPRALSAGVSVVRGA